MKTDHWYCLMIMHFQHPRDRQLGTWAGIPRLGNELTFHCTASVLIVSVLQTKLPKILHLSSVDSTVVQ